MKKILLLVSFILLSCSESNMKSKSSINYPFKADKERIKHILSQYKKIEINDNLDKVLEIMGKPDEVNDTYDKNAIYKKIGYSYVYLIQRDKENGSFNDKNEKLVRIIFNLNDKVVQIDLW